MNDFEDAPIDPSEWESESTAESQEPYEIGVGPGVDPGQRLALAEFGRKRWAWGHCTVTTWGAVVARALRHVERDDKDGPGFVPGALILAEPPADQEQARRFGCNIHRANRNVRSLFLLGLDLDDDADLQALEDRLAPYEYVAYTTHSHTEAKPHWRLLLPLARSVSAKEWKPFWHAACRHLTGRDDVADQQVKDPARFYFWPSCGAGAPRHAIHHPGAALDPDALPREVAPASGPTAGSSGKDGKVVAVEMEGPPIPDGARNDTLYRIACSLRSKGLDESDIDAQLHAINEARCRPPITVEDSEGWENLCSMARRVCERHGPGTSLDRLGIASVGDAGGIGGVGGSTSVVHDEGVGEAPTDRDAGIEPGAAPWTELGNAERLAARHAGALCHCEQWGWLAYQNGYWETGAEKVAFRRLCETVRAMRAGARELEEEDRTKYLAFATKSENARPIFSALRMAAGLSQFSVETKQLDQHHHLLNVANGVVDLQKGVLLSHDSALRLTQQTGLPYLTDAQCPRWERFLTEVFDGDQDLIAFIQRAIGYSLTGDVREETLFFMSGDGSNGKSVLLDTLVHILGPYAMPAPPNLLMASRADRHPTEIAGMRGKRFVMVSESKDGARLDEEKIKQLVSSDPISARFMNKDFFTFLPTHKLWLTSNYRPIVRGTDAGIWRRLPLIPFNVRFRDVQEGLLPGELPKDLGLKEYLRDQEAAGILAWAVRGAVTWYRDGLQPPAVVLEASKEYRDDMDWIGQFLSECCREDEAAVTPAAAIYQAYRDWCARQGEQPRTQTAFGEFLAKRGLRKVRTPKYRAWSGYALRSQAEILGDQPFRI